MDRPHYPPNEIAPGQRPEDHDFAPPEDVIDTFPGPHRLSRNERGEPEVNETMHDRFEAELEAEVPTKEARNNGPGNLD